MNSKYTPCTTILCSLLLWAGLTENTKASGYAAWAEGWGVPLGAETNDYDGDGLVNIAEFALDGDPTNALDQGTAPVFEMVEGSNMARYIHPQRSDPASGLVYSLQLCTNLVEGSWSGDGYTVTGTNVTGGTLDVVSNTTDRVADQKFIRLVIGYTPEMPRTVYHVDAYGAVPNDGNHDGEAIRSCIAAAIADGGPTEVRFSSGVYDCSIDGSTPVFEIKEANDLWFNGAGKNTELLFHKNAQISMNVENCTNVVLKNFSVDYKYLPFTQGTVTDLGSDYVDVVLDAGYPDFYAPIFNTGDNKQLHKMEQVGSDWLKRDTFKANFTYEHQGGTTWRIRPKASFLNINDRIVLKSRVWFSSQIRDSTDCAYENVTFYCGLGFTTLGANTTRLRYTDCAWMVRPGTTRMMGPIADGIHSLGNRDGLTIENCLFKGQGDDAINMHSREAAIIQVVSPTNLKIQTHKNLKLRLNDWISVMDMSSGTEKGQGQISAISFEEDLATVTLNNSISGVSTTDKVFNLTACGNDSVIKNCSISSGRLLIRGHHVMVTNNTFSLGGGLAFRISGDYPEGPIPYQVMIENNIFAPSDRFDYQVFANIKTSTGGSSGSKIWGLTFSNNEFYDAAGISMYLKNVADLSFVGASQKIDVAAGVPEAARSLIFLVEYSNVEFNDMTFIDPNDKTAILVNNINGDTVRFVGCNFSGLNSNTTISTGSHTIE